MKLKYKCLRRFTSMLMRLALLGAFALFGFSLHSFSQTLVTNPADGHYCEGGLGVEICVENSVNGQVYEVIYNGIVINTILGNGGTACCFGFTDPGVYTTNPPSGSVTVVVDPLPVKPTIVGDFYQCGYYNLTTFVTYNNLPVSNYTFTWQAIGHVNSGSLQGFYALPDENSLDLILGNADWALLRVTVMDNATGCEITSNDSIVYICPEITNNFISADTNVCYMTEACFDGTLPLGGCNNFTYLWQKSLNGISGWTPAWCCTPTTNDGEDYCTPGLPGGTWYLRRVVLGNACQSISNVVMLHVYDEFLPGDIQPDYQEICYNTVPACLDFGIAPSGGDGSYTYQWYESLDGSSFTVIQGATNPQYCPPALIADHWYYCEVTNLCGILNTDTAYIEVWDPFIPGVIGDDQSICYNTIPNQLCFTTPPTGGQPGVYSYQWQESVNCTGTWVDIPGETATCYQPPALTDTTCYRVMVFNLCDTLPTNAVQIKVWDEFIVNPILQTDTSICYNTAPGCLGPVTATGGECNGNGTCYTYQWFNSSGPISGETNPSLCLGALTTTDTYYCEVTDLSCGTVATPNSVTITVWDPFDPGTVGFIPDECNVDSVDICYNTIPPCISFCIWPFGGQPGIYSYQWLESSDGVNFNPINGEINDTLCPPALIQTTYYKCQVTNLCATGATNIVKVHVWDPFMAGDIGFDPDPCALNADTVCYNTAPECIAPCVDPQGGNTVDGYTYKWFGSMDGITFTEIAGEVNPVYCPPALFVDHWYYRWDMNECGEVSTDTVWVKVWPEFVAGTVGYDQTICYNTVPDSLVEVTSAIGGDGSYTYQWQMDVLCTGAWVDIAGATFPGYQPPALTDTTCFRRIDMNICDTLPTNVIQINVWDAFDPGAVCLNNNNLTDTSICYNTAPDLFKFCTLPSGGEPGVYSYQWQMDINCTGNWTDIIGATSDTYQSPALLDTTCFRLMVYNLCDTLATNTIQINVWDDFEPGTVGFGTPAACLDADTVCYNTAPGCIDFCIPPFGGKPGDYSYLWYSSTDNINFNPIDPPVVAPQYCPPPLTETTYYKCQVTNLCEVNMTNVVTAFVWDEFLAGNIGFDPYCLDKDTVCYNTAPDCIWFCAQTPSGGNTIQGYTYQWYESTDQITYIPVNGATGSQYCPPALMTDHWYYCEVTNECGILNTDTIWVMVWPEFIAGTIEDDQVICSLDNPDLLTEVTPPTGGDGVYTYQWQVDTLCTGNWQNVLSDGNGTNYQPPVLVNNTGFAIDYCFRRLDMNLCDTLPTNVVTITVNPLPPPFTITGTDEVCANTSVYYCVEPPDESNYYYSWSVIGGLLDPDSCCGVCALINWGAGGTGLVIVTKENQTTGCILIDTLVVTIYDIPTPVITGPTIVYEGDTATYTVPAQFGHLYNWFVTGGAIYSGSATKTVEVIWGPAGQGYIMISEKMNQYPFCCGVGELAVTILPVGPPTISGNVTYHNTYNTPMNNVEIDLRNQYNVIVQSTSTHFDFMNGNGYYDFYNVLNGSYSTDLSTTIPFGGVNATDALAIKLHTIGTITLGPLPLMAADVNASGNVNATDALYVIYRTINYISDFPAGDWVFDDQPLNIAGPVVNNIKGLCYGDVNGSYIPSGYKDAYNYALISDGILTVEPGEVFELPVKIDRNAELGAMTVTLNYSGDLVDVINVVTPDNDNMLYTVDDHTVRIAWSNTTPMQLAENDAVITLTLRALDVIAEGDQLIALGQTTEFADPAAATIDEITFKTLDVSTSIIGGYALSHNFPNPFSEYTDIEFTIPESGRVLLNVYDILGNKIATLEDGIFDAGTYTSRFTVDGNKPGVYIYELQVNGETTEFSDLRKMMIK